VFRWRARPGSDRLTNSWNARYAGTLAGSRTPDGYSAIDLDKRHFRASRLAWIWVTGCWPAALVDHIDLDPTNDRWGNLRAATHGQNMTNQPGRAASGLKGAYRQHPAGRWFSVISEGRGKNRHLGTFDTAEQAHAAWVEAARPLHGQFFRT
jgi:hypothetical protein